MARSGQCVCCSVGVSAGLVSGQTLFNSHSQQPLPARSRRRSASLGACMRVACSMCVCVCVCSVLGGRTQCLAALRSSPAATQAEFRSVRIELCAWAVSPPQPDINELLDASAGACTEITGVIVLSYQATLLDCGRIHVADNNSYVSTLDVFQRVTLFVHRVT